MVLEVVQRWISRPNFWKLFIHNGFKYINIYICRLLVSQYFFFRSCVNDFLCLMFCAIYSLALKGKWMISCCHLWAKIILSKNEREERNYCKRSLFWIIQKLGWSPVFREQMVCCFCCHKYTMRKWNALDKERVEGLQIKLEQTEYCIMMLQPTSDAENTEVLFLDRSAIMAHRTASLQDTEFSNSTITIHWFKWITAIVLF